MSASDPHDAPVPESAWQADLAARARGRVEMFNATRPGGLDGWTVSVEQYGLLRSHVLETLGHDAPRGRGVPLSDLVRLGQERLGDHPAFPGGRLRNYVTYVKVDLQARQEIERVPGGGPQRLRLRDRRPGDDGFEGPPRATSRH